MLLVILLQSCIDCLLSGQHHIKWRARHSTIVNAHRLYCWGGYQENLPMIHDNDKKRKFTSSVDVFHLPTLKWERKSTTATPPAGVMDYACTNIKDNIMYFGGRCQLHVDDCYHNDLFELNTLTNEWKEIKASPDNGPMRKRSCRMISFNINQENNLLLIGGFGPTQITTHTGSKYIPHHSIPNRCFTDEIHMMCVNSSPGIT